MPPREIGRTACPACGESTWRPAYVKSGWRIVRCGRCRVLRLDPLPAADELAAHCAARAEHGNYELARAHERNASLEEVFRFVDRQRGPARAGRILDVGCFDGALLDVAGGHGWDAWGVELQPAAAAVEAAKHPGRIVVGSLEGLDRAALPGRFDVITAIDVIEHMLDPDLLFALAAEQLAADGMLVIQTPHVESAPARLLRRFWPFLAVPEHTYLLGRRSLARAGAAHGFGQLRCRRRVKRLRLGYVVDQLAHFGPELHRAISPVATRARRRILDVRAPLHAGEMFCAARRSAA